MRNNGRPRQARSARLRTPPGHPFVISRAPGRTDARRTAGVGGAALAGSAPRGRRRTRVRERPDARRRERARSDVTSRSPNERRPCGEGAVPALARRRRSLGPPPGGASVEARGRGGLGRRTAAAPGCGRRSGRAQAAAPPRPMSARWRLRGRRREEGGAESAGAGRRAAGAAGWGCCS